MGFQQGFRINTNTSSLDTYRNYSASQAGMERNSVFAELNEEAEEIDADARAAELAAGPGDAPRLRLLATAIRDLTRSLR